jgi:glycosyltransferase involved in cell wall biosynthesis
VVSVCIRAHSRRDELAQAIASVLAQTHQDFEVVVSDDSGRLAEVVERFGDPRVRHVSNPAPSGPAGNLRHAVSHARGDVLAMLNDDDWWEPRFLETCVGALSADPSVEVVFTDQWLDIEGRRVRHRFRYAHGRHGRFLREVLQDGLPASATALRRSAFAPPPDGMVGDFHMCIEAAHAGHAFHYVPEPLSVTRVHRGQGSWSEEGLPDRMIATLAAFRFDDSGADALRRARLVEQYLTRAGRSARRGRLRAATGDLRQARHAGGSLSAARIALALSGLRGLIMRTAPPRAIALALEHWPRVRPAVLRRAAPGS